MKRLLILPLLIILAACATEKKSFYQSVDSSIKWASLQSPERLSEKAAITAKASEGKQAFFLVELTPTEGDKLVLAEYAHGPIVRDMFRRLDKICHDAAVTRDLSAGWTYSYILVPSAEPSKMLSKVVYDKKTCSTVAKSD